MNLIRIKWEETGLYLKTFHAAYLTWVEGEPREGDLWPEGTEKDERLTSRPGRTIVTEVVIADVSPRVENRT